MTGVVSLRLASMTPEQVALLRSELTLYRRVMNGGSGPVCFAQEAGGWMHIPRGWYLKEGGRFPFLQTMLLQEGRADGHQLPPGTRSTMALGKPPFPESQPTFVQEIHQGSVATGIGGRVGAPTRYGKTGCAIAAAIRLGGSILVLTDRAMVADQWADEWNTWVVGATGATIPAGRIQGDRFDLPPRFPFVVGMMQTLMRRPLDEDQRAAFRTVILDEADCAPTDSAMAALQRFRARYVLGLSATPDRKDGLGKAIEWICGPCIAEATRPLEADVWFAHIPWRKVKVPTRAGDKMRAPRLARPGGGTDTVEAEKAMLRDEDRVAFIAREARRGVDHKRHGLILVGLRDHAEVLARAARREGLDPAILQGGQTRAERRSAMQHNPCIATLGSCAKGGNFEPAPGLCILAAPRADVRQAMGRALQPQATVRTTILDLVDGHPKLIKMAKARLKGSYRINPGFRVLNEVWPYEW